MDLIAWEPPAYVLPLLGALANRIFGPGHFGGGLSLLYSPREDTFCCYNFHLQVKYGKNSIKMLMDSEVPASHWLIIS